jgi:hypothetical protein
MTILRDWSLLKVILVSTAWVVVVVCATVAWVVLPIAWPSGAGSAGIGAVSIGLTVDVAGLVLFGPPLIVILTWIVARTRRSRAMGYGDR